MLVVGYAVFHAVLGTATRDVNSSCCAEVTSLGRSHYASSLAVTRPVGDMRWHENIGQLCHCLHQQTPASETCVR